MEILIKDVANLSSNNEDGCYEADFAPRVGDLVSYRSPLELCHYEVLKVWYSANPGRTSSNAYVFCKKLAESPFETMKKQYEETSDDEF